MARFLACGDDDEENKPSNEQPGDNTGGNPEEKPELKGFTDYAADIDMTVQTMLQKYGEPDMNLGKYYMYSFESGSTSAITSSSIPRTTRCTPLCKYWQTVPTQKRN